MPGISNRQSPPANHSKRLEVWNTREGTVVKVAVRDSLGRFNGATNFRASLTVR